MRTYRALAALLTYPTAEMIDAVAEIENALVEEAVLTADQRRAVERLTRELRGGDLLDLQERYVALFDRTPSLALHLFEHLHGDSRDRGQAMADLIELYRQHGFEIAAAELPDFLPLFVEFLGERSAEEAKTMLGDIAHLVALLHQRLAKRGSAYAGVMAALLGIAGVKVDLPAEDAGEAEDSPEAIDRAWEDKEVRFGFGDTDVLKTGTTNECTKAAAMLRRMETLQPGGR
jgi:nitrate reductase delta subunit